MAVQLLPARRKKGRFVNVWKQKWTTDMNMKLNQRSHKYDSLRLKVGTGCMCSGCSPWERGTLTPWPRPHAVGSTFT